MHILVTGGAGFIGSNIAEYHLAKGDSVYVVDDLSTGTKENLASFEDNPNFRFVQADILTWPELEKATEWADRIYHMAAIVGVYRVLAEPIKVLAVNISACERVLRAVGASKWRPKVLIASSAEVYGPNNVIPLKEDLTLVTESGAKSRWNYSISKIADEAFGLSYARKLEIPVTLLRIFNTIGPRQTGRYGMVVPRFISQALHNEPITIFGDGTQTRSFCDVRDSVVMFDLLANNPASAGQIVNVGNDHEISIKDLANLVKGCTNSNSEFNYVPHQKAYIEDFEETLRRKPDVTKLYELTSYKPKWTLEATINNLISLSKK